MKDFLLYRYHKPADEYDPELWNFAGIYQDAEIYYQIGDELVNFEYWPKWEEGSEFKTIRERSK